MRTVGGKRHSFAHLEFHVEKKPRKTTEKTKRKSPLQTQSCSLSHQDFSLFCDFSGRCVLKKTPRLLRSFAQKRIVTEDTHSLVPGMSLDDDFFMYVGTASAETRSVSFSTTAAANQNVSRESHEDARSQESTDS